MVSKPALRDGILTLVEVDSTRLGWVEGLARRAIQASGANIKLEVSTDYREHLKGADFVILAFAVKGVELRDVDATISTRYGMTMSSGDTIGPGGTFRTLREVPRQAEILEEVRRVCPDAWVINWVNPTAAMGIAMMRHFPDLKSIAICDGPHNPRFEDSLIVQAGLAPNVQSITPALRSRTKIRITGVNHFNWLTEMRYEDKDITPRVIEALRQASQDHHPIGASEDGKVELANKIASQLASSIGNAPMCIWHTQEYVPYFMGHGINKADTFTIKQWRVDLRRKWMNEVWDEMEGLASGRLPIEPFLENTRPDHASDIIETMWTGNGRLYYINMPNNGAVTNMPDDAYLELPTYVELSGVRPLAYGKIPRPLTGFIQRVLDEHELAVEAAVTCDRRILRQAFLASMVTVNIADVDACIDEMLEAEREYIPAGWYKDKEERHSSRSQQSPRLALAT
jgi:alpha-galactosidase